MQIRRMVHTCIWFTTLQQAGGAPPPPSSLAHGEWRNRMNSLVLSNCAYVLLYSCVVLFRSYSKLQYYRTHTYCEYCIPPEFQYYGSNVLSSFICMIFFVKHNMMSRAKIMCNKSKWCGQIVLQHLNPVVSE